MGKLLSLVFAIITSVFIFGCGEETEPEPVPRVMSVNVKEGDEIPCNAIITVTFSKEMDAESVVIMLNAVPVYTTSDDGKTFRFTPGMRGEFVLNIIGEDMTGQFLDPPYNPINIKLIEPDTTPPMMIDDECDPKNGATGVDPARYKEGFAVVFSERMAEVTIVARDPEFPSIEELSVDGKTLKIKFDKYRLSNEMECKIKLVGTDLAGNPLPTTEYSFTTMAMEDGWELRPSLDVLFGIGIGYRPTLDDKRVSQGLIKEFGNNGFFLSENAAVSIGREGRAWLITDRDNRMEYIAARHDDNKIGIYTLSWFGWSDVEVKEHSDLGFLFSVGPEHGDSLDKKTIPKALRDEFNKNGFPLSPDAYVPNVPGGKAWAIIDDVDDMEYFIMRDVDENRIDIYIIAKPEFAGLGPPPEVLRVDMPERWDIPMNRAITVTFSKKMDPESVVIALNGIPVRAGPSPDGTEFKFSLISSGETELTIVGKDMLGQALDPPYPPLRFMVIDPDFVPPRIVDGKCSPENGAMDVNPLDCEEKLVIVFSEPMNNVEVVSKLPRFGSVDELNRDHTALTIWFTGHQVSKGRVYTIRLAGADMAGNGLADPIYSFQTLAWNWIPIPGEELFSVGLEHRDDLDDEELSADLRQEFRDNGFPLSQDAEVIIEKEGSAWMINDGLMEYFLIKSDGKIDVYEDAGIMFQ